MIVIADASPLNYPVLIGHVEVLRQLYARVLVPAGVVDELTASGAPASVREWMSVRSEWIEVRHVDVPVNSGLEAVDEGEAEAILLAEGLRPDVLLLIDDRDGRQEATRRGIATTGTLGVLNDAAGRGFLDLEEALARLGQTTFRASPALIAALAEQAGRSRPQ